jgi:hypothetical protein
MPATACSFPDRSRKKRDLKNSRCRPSLMLAVVAAYCLSDPACHAALTVIGVQYQQDRVFPEYECLWHDRLYPGPCGTSTAGANLKVFVKNTGTSPETIEDVKLAGYRLNTVLQRNADGASSIYFYWGGTPPQTILDAGEPVWYKGDPAASIPTGGVAQVVVRLRNMPTTPTVAVGVVGASATVTTNITVDAGAPQLASVGFSPDRMKVYLHWRRAGGAAPATVWLDGVNVTAATTTVGDATVNFAESVVQLALPLPAMSFHVYQGVYADGKTATGGLRTWVNPYLYATWGSSPDTSSTVASGQAWIDEATAHGVNCLVMNWNDALGALLSTSSGRDYAENRGYGFVIHDPGQFFCTTPRMWFIFDEPDYTDWTIAGLPNGTTHSPGVMAMKMLETGETLRASYPLAPTTVNIDGNLKPYNYWNWGQVPDVLMNDAYYQSLLAYAYWTYTYKIPLYQKATYIYASAQVATLSCEPNPMHMILYSCSLQQGGGGAWPFAPPATKRIEAYYALAGGAKGMAYWWFLLDPVFRGMGDGSPAALALWKEIGLLGAEIKTAQPLLVTSHPVDWPLDPSSGVWARALAAGTDTMILLAVNDNYTNDYDGCHYNPIANANVTVTLPSWMQFPTAFEISAGGLSDVNMQTNGNQVVVSLGTLNLTRMIVLTRNPSLRSAIQARYVGSAWPGICTMAPELCSAQAAVVTQQPASASAEAGTMTSFTVGTGGSNPRSFRWQKNQLNLNDGGHYSGCTAATLTVTNVDISDAASYRCVVTNAYGSVTSAAATLTVGGGSLCIANPGFEGNFTLSGGSYIGNGWTEWESLPGGATGYDETTTIHGGSHAQRIRVWNTNSALASASGGVYQRVPVTPGYTYTISTWIYALDTSSACYVGADPYGGTDPNSDVVWSSVYASPSWAKKSVTSTAQADYLTVFLKVVSVGTDKHNGYFDDATPTCTVTNLPPSITQQPANQTAAAGNPASFAIQASGTSPLSYQWQKNTVNLSNAGHYSGCTTATLSISSADSTDVASYRCIVTNAYGNAASGVATLTVTTNLPPNITQQPDSQSVAAGGSANFTIQASGTLPLSYRWQKNQINLNDGGHYAGSATAVLSIGNVDNTDAASYRCVVTNAYGSATSGPATLVVTNAFGQVTLTNIPPLAGDTSNEARAVAPDGSWVVGVSGTSGFLYDVSGVNILTNCSLPNAASAVASTATGVGYRTANGQREIILSGLSSGWNIDYMTTNGNSFGAKRRDANVGTAPVAVLANGLAGTASDVFYSTWYDSSGSANQLYVGRFSGTWPATTAWDKTAAGSTVAQTHGVSATGRAVGFRGSPKTNYALDWTGTGTATTWSFNGLDGSSSGEAFAITTNGTIIFGQSPVSGGRAGSWPYRAVVSSAVPGVLQSVSELPSFPDTVGTSGSAGVPYGCTVDGKYAVGTSYRGMERAVLWNLSDTNTANWMITDLTDLASARGKLGVFSRLARAYSVASNGTGALVVVGTGVDTNGTGNNRAFVMTLAPVNGGVVPRPTVTVSGAYPAGFTFTFPTVASVALTYYLEYATNLFSTAAWTPVASTPGTGSKASLSDPNPYGTQRFYRVRIH